MEITSNMIIKADGTTRQNIEKGTGIKTPHIQDDAVTTAKIKNESVASSKICKADNTTGQDVSKGLGIKTPHIQNGAVTTAKTGNVAITEIKIANGAVTESKLGNNSVTSSKIRDGSVGNAEIANGAVTSAKLANDSVTYEKLDLNTRGKLVTKGDSHTHSTADVGALPITGGTVNGNLSVNGNVGIGTAASGQKLEVKGNICKHSPDTEGIYCIEFIRTDEDN